ncbi:general secretion pathway protein N [Mitsuaria sp. BK045]|uniref:type II secretion system protein N n=1 Tax=unclassified Roseateles TaxID=2626991 RepID=UPI00161B6169|nr:MULTISPECIES: type II secretion system protein N [unclassified Roseateles]MBB3295160.1 general secretion pathway protein N [Mitsuaria sp. BK041]MBB3364376.1 general secretion pathway protein N [Mitsuaria sp. BK045]
MARRSSARLTTSTANAASTTSFVRAFRWAEFGAVLGLVTAVVAWAPAAWLASAVSSATHQRLVLADARGTLWNGSARLILSPGPGSRDASELPQRLGWTMRPGWIDGGPGLRLTLDQSCCIKPAAPLTASFGLDRLTVRLPDATPEQPWIRWPAGWLSGLGTPWNTLAPDGVIAISAQGFVFEGRGAAVNVSGVAQVELRDFSSRLAQVAPLGSYRMGLVGGGQTPQLILTTIQGPLQLSGQGSLGAKRAQFRGEATAAPGSEAALANLLNIIGRREGARSIISVG